MTLRTRAHITAVLFFAGAVVLYCFEPENSAFYPKCPVWTLFHVYCPGCGATRALAALVHGRLSAALHYNVLVTLLAPIVLGYLAAAYVSVLRQGKPRWITVPAPLTFFILLATVVFAVARNYSGLMFKL